MDVRRLLAGLSGARCSLQRGGGGVPDLTSADVAAGLGRIDGDAAALLLYIWAGHGDLAGQLASQLLERFAPDDDDDDVPTWRAVIVSVLAEKDRPVLCWECQGSGQIVARGEYQDCQACGGSGKKPWSAARRRDATGISRYRWERGWSDRYEKLRSDIDALEVYGLRALRIELIGDKAA